ncbi:MAG: HDOD domain-containing protein [Phycisphaeraceae bacterium]|nr:HDOD domain-containing protein [Phycisphaeraceae bacterium]MCW5755325.1 HDOD domain-containing protein [Phycisphaeraceae bacterium]
MNALLLETILKCPNLPSLPAVAARVVEMTAQEDVSLDELAKCIQNDQGLAVKILKTVNSSFYGLRTRCATIQRAMVMLGLGPVKGLALGFSLVQAIGQDGEDFDYVSYWRRALLTAAAAKLIADAVDLHDISNEAFLGGLFQDIGMLAMHRALGPEYQAVIQQAQGDHRRLVKYELAAFELQHPDIGAMLCARWKLPDELLLPVKYHERPTASPPKCTEIVRVVTLGNFIHDVLSTSEPANPLRRAYAKGAEWFRLTPETVDGIVRNVSAAIGELSRLFSLDTGEHPDAERILAEAESQIGRIAAQDSPEGEFIRNVDRLTICASETDSLTGVFNRTGFDSVMRSAFVLGKSRCEPVSVVLLALDDFAEICRVGPDEIDGEIALGVTSLLKRHFDPVGGVVGRLGPDLFGVVATGKPRAQVTELAERFRKDLDCHSQQWVVPDYPGKLRVTASVGVSGNDQWNPGGFVAPEQLQAASLRAAQAAKVSGGNTVRTFIPRMAA